MRIRARALPALISACLLALAWLPPTAAAWPPTFAPDAYESPGDDTPASARDITYAIAAAGKDPYTEAHTFDAATSGGVCDEDWFRFSVGAADADAGIVYLFEAVANDDRAVNPVIEIYGPGLSFTPNPGNTLPVLTLDSASVAGAIRGRWWEHLGASLTFRPTAAGTYFLRVRPYGDSVSGGYYDNAGRYTFRAKVGDFTRVYGPDRVRTSVRISEERFADITLRGGMGYFNLRTAIVANGYNFPDALAGASLAGVCQGPILLTKKDSLPGETRAELVRLDPDRVYVLGGPPAVSDAVVQQIRDAFPSWAPVTVERIAGQDRIATADRIARKTRQLVTTASPPWPGTPFRRFAFLANGYNYPDALAASSMSAGNFAPILLTRQDRLDPRVLDCIRDLGITDVAIVGGPSVVSADIQTRLRAELGSAHVIRLAGADRYQTAKVFATWAAGLPADTASVGTPGRPDALTRSERETIAVCRGDDFPDALSAAPFCSQGWFSRPKPILLTPSKSTSPWLYDTEGRLPSAQRSFLEEVWAVTGTPTIGRSYIFGGPPAVSNWTFWQLDVQS